MPFKIVDAPPSLTDEGNEELHIRRLSLEIAAMNRRPELYLYSASRRYVVSSTFATGRKTFLQAAAILGDRWETEFVKYQYSAHSRDESITRMVVEQYFPLHHRLPLIRIIGSGEPLDSTDVATLFPGDFWGSKVGSTIEALSMLASVDWLTVARNIPLS